MNPSEFTYQSAASRAAVLGIEELAARLMIVFACWREGDERHCRDIRRCGRR
jgi:hypothetical protein